MDAWKFPQCGRLRSIRPCTQRHKECWSEALSTILRRYISRMLQEDLTVRRVFLILTVVLLFVIVDPIPIDAGTTPTVNIVGVDVRNDATFLVDISQATTGAPACATVTNRLSANSSTAGGKSL